MPKKKKFIDRKNAVTFHLVHRSQRDPLQADEDAPKHVLLQADDSEKRDARMSEQRKFGVFFEDEYDYLQHLKDADEIYTDLEPEEYVVKREPAIKQVEQTQVPTLTLPSSVFATDLETEVGLLNKAVPIRGPQPNWDPDIVAGLDEDFDFDDPHNQLEDDFILQANTGQLMPENGLYGDEANMDSEQGYPSDEADEDVSDLGSFGERSFMEDETKSRFTNYSMTSSVIRRNEGLTLLDDRFEKIYEQYDDDEIGALDQEEIEGSVQQSSTILQSVMEEFEQTQFKPKLKDVVDESEETADNVEIISESDSETSDTEMVRMKVEEPKIKWDCESILSTHSTLYNHPKTIEAPKKQKFIKLTKRVGIPVDSLPTKDITRKQLESHLRDERNVDRAATYRDKSETTEEKKARKQAVKQERKERRIEKKATKQAFKSEEIRQGKEIMNLQKNIQGMKIT